jgi:hypothetical protein
MESEFKLIGELLFKLLPLNSVMKAQVSIEFFTYFSLVTLVLAVMVSSIADKQAEASDFRENSLASNIADKISFEMQQADEAGRNYSRNFTLPASIIGRPYNVTLRGDIVLVSWSNTQVTSSSTVEVKNQEIIGAGGTMEVSNDGNISLSS